MLALKAIDVKNNFKLVCARVFNGETVMLSRPKNQNVVMLSRPKNQNVVMLSEKEYNELAKAKRNLEYYAMLDESDQQLKTGRVVEKTMEELEAMAEE